MIVEGSIKLRFFSLAIIVWVCWFVFAGPQPAFYYIEEHWYISLTMAFGSLIAGATSEGGGAIAFPVFTKLLNISPQDAKVFSLAIQSIGMTAASLIILALKIRVEKKVLLWVSFGGMFGMYFGATVLSPLLPSAMVKMSFTVMIVSFAITLYFLNRGIELRNQQINNCQNKEISLLFVTGLIGGLMSGLVGNGIDIIAFSVMVLLFRINEKIATPTSVILMAINAIWGFFLHYFFIGGFNDTVQAYWLAAIPIVVIGAPLGALICYHLPRVVIVNFLIILIMIEFVTSLLLIPLTIQTLFMSGIMLILFASLFLWMFKNQSYIPKHHLEMNISSVKK